MTHLAALSAFGFLFQFLHLDPKGPAGSCRGCRRSIAKAPRLLVTLYLLPTIFPSYRQRFSGFSLRDLSRL
jgi:hypothetical protein